MCEEKKRITYLDLKEKALYMHYLEILKSYGTKARFLTKDQIYEEAARPFFIASNRASRIITKMIKEGVTIDQVRSEQVSNDIKAVKDAISKCEGNITEE